MSQVNTLLATNGNAIAAREVAFAPLRKLSTKMLNALKATEVSAAVIANMKTHNRKIQGQRATSIQEPVVTVPNPGANLGRGPGQDPDLPPTQISAAQLSYDSLVDTFDKQVKLLASLPEYAPNEPELTVANLQALYSTLKTANAAVVNNGTQISNGRLSRNQIMYNPETGLTATSADVKSYVKSIFGASSPNYKQISALSFKTVK